MLFYTPEFLFAFLPLVLGVFLVLQRRDRQASMAWLLGASLVFYAWWKPVYAPLLLASVSVNYLIGSRLCRRPDSRLLALGVGFNLALIGFYKYGAFLAANVNALTGLGLPLPAVDLPLAISFFTFQQIAYLVDASRGRTAPHGPLSYGLFVVFFPQLIAGPIVSQREMLPQFNDPRRLHPGSRDFAVGLTLLIAGLGKKILIADQFAAWADPAFNAAAAGTALSFLEGWGAALSYTLQLYFDFSGYSDMAIGLGRLFGLRLPANFDSPYKARSIIDFWRRWHITMSRFFRDYVYFPLGGSRRGPARNLVNLAAVMLLCGLWHGAGWTFVVWGGLHGLLLAGNHLWRKLAAPKLPAMGAPLAWALTFLAVTCGWVLFRAETWGAAGAVLSAMCGGGRGLLLPDGLNAPLVREAVHALGGAFVHKSALPFQFGDDQFLWILGTMACCLLSPNSQQWLARFSPCLGRVAPVPSRLGRVLQWRPRAGYAVAMGALLVAVVWQYLSQDTPPAFIYFNF
ncbi:MBOAT family O-acyltransferase [Desulfocurvus sp. DL9XJH121]